MDTIPLALKHLAYFLLANLIKLNLNSQANQSFIKVYIRISGEMTAPSD
jgi:hypothetical protein